MEKEENTLSVKTQSDFIPLAMDALNRPVVSTDQDNSINLRREQEWGETYGDYSDEAILDYLRRCGAALGHCPKTREVVGYTHIKKRFGPWPRVLERAGFKEESAKRIARITAKKERYRERREQRYAKRKEAREKASGGGDALP